MMVPAIAAEAAVRHSEAGHAARRLRVARSSTTANQPWPSGAKTADYRMSPTEFSPVLPAHLALTPAVWLVVDILAAEALLSVEEPVLDGTEQQLVLSEIPAGAVPALPFSV